MPQSSFLKPLEEHGEAHSPPHSFKQEVSELCHCRQGVPAPHPVPTAGNTWFLGCPRADVSDRRPLPGSCHN